VDESSGQCSDARPAAAEPIRVGITGHVDLTASTVLRVAAELRRHLVGLCDPATTRPADLVGVTCLARGADSVFAEVLVDLGGRLEVILPSADYGEAQVGPDHAPVFDAMLDRAVSVRTMPAPRAEQKAYIAANHALLDAIDQLLAVWDGEPVAVDGSTASVVQTARARNIPVTVIWPEGARRDSQG
jgi:hypothetical protein